MTKEVYLDNSATTKIRPESLARYVEVSTEHFGNASSLHHRGVDAEGYVKEARETVLGALGTKEGYVVFTSGGTESNNLALFGRALSKGRFRGGRILTGDGEHSSVLATLERLKAQGFEVVTVPTVGGVIDMAALEAAANEKVILATFMLVNNETGAHYDTAAVKRVLARKCPNAVLHVDATQGFLKVPCTVKSTGADMITLSSHKVSGPKGVGALWISPALIREKGILPQAIGGGQENGLRSGTLNVPGIAAFGAAVAAARSSLTAEVAHLASLREYFLDRLYTDDALASLRANLPKAAAPHIVSLTLPRIKSETMLHHLSALGIYVSSGSACSSHGGHTSRALLAFGLTEKEADFTLRVSFGRENTKEDVDALCAALADGLAHLQRLR